MPHRAPIRRHSRLLQAVALALIVLTAAAAAWQFHAFLASAERVKRSHEAMAAVSDTQSALYATESSARGYRIYKQAAMMSDYHAKREATIRHLDRAKALNPEPEHAELLTRLAGLIRLRLSILDQLIDIQRDGHDPAEAGNLASQGLQAMLDSEAVTTRFLTELTEDLNRRQHALQRNSSWLMWLSGLGLAGALALLVALQISLRKEAIHSRQLERDSRDALTQLEKTHGELGRLSAIRQELNEYSNILQGCQSIDEAMQATRAVIGQLLPGSGGRVYGMRASQNLAETLVEFGHEHAPSNDIIAPDQCWAMRQGRRHRSQPGGQHPLCQHLDAEAAHTARTVCIPLSAQGATLGLLHTSQAAEHDDSDAIDVLNSIADHLSQAMANLQLRETLRLQSVRDPLTGLYNRRYLEANLEREFQRCQRRGLQMTVMMLDVDHFKRFNDQHGHGAGDALLAAVGQTIARVVREEDIACRYGGEEFTVVLPECSEKDAHATAERIRVAIEKLTVEYLRTTYGPASISIGVACLPLNGERPESLMAAADRALYQAKERGRNRVEFAPPGASSIAHQGKTEQ